MLSEALSQAFEDATEQEPFIPDPAKAVIRSRRMRRRRRWTTAAGLTVSVAGIAVGAVFAFGGVSQQPFTVSPAAPSAPALASIRGVDVTWLPNGLRAHSSQPSMGSSSPTLLNQDTFTQNFENPHAKSPGPQIVVAVQREKPDVDLDWIARDDLVATGSSSTKTWVKVTTSFTSIRGHRALLLGLGPSNYELLWVEQSGLSISISASGGPSLAELTHVASGLVIHPEPVPVPNAQAATTAIRNAFERAYNAGPPAAVQLQAVENGDQLTSVLAQLTQQIPATVHTSKITVGNVIFLDPTHASVDYSLAFQYQGHVVTAGGPGTAVLTNGAWKVSEASFCNSIQRPGVTLTCPPE
jgi:hypothetical protein